MRLHPVGQTAARPRAGTVRPLHEHDRAQSVEMLETARVVQRRLIGQEHDLEFASQALQEPFNAPCAAVARGKDAERRDEQQAGTRAAGVQIEAERGREFA